ncbi:hypothetical protein [Burkholderia gladioli]|uniref:hypothetical protein n=1 Tax=Burkholderia gladioli TaxID=28095 RepID=UPI00163E5B4E|nr:hypothetical protein [Burkholderia gladioli]
MTGTPNFFIPHAENPEQAEEVYQAFLKNSTVYDPVHPEARIYSVHFSHNGKWHEATVGRRINHFPEETGEVLAIIERSQIVCIHTVLRGALSATPIYTDPARTKHRRYFADFPRST